MRSGLSRPTVGLVLSTLASAGLVTVGKARQGSGGGRPSPVVEPTDQHLVATVYVDVTGVEVALCGLGGRILAVAATNSSVRDPEWVVGEAARLLDRLLVPFNGISRVLRVVAVVPGRVKSDEGLVVNAPHLQWQRVALATALAEATGLPSELAHDGHAGALAEWRWGTGRETNDLIYLYAGPGGVGAGIISAGSLLRGSHELAGRLAHVAVSDDGPLCYCGAHGCLTTHLSAAALDAAIGGNGVERSAASLAERMADLGADHPVMQRLAAQLTRGLRTVVAVFDPDVIVLAGALTGFLNVAGTRVAGALAHTNLDVARDAVRVVEPTLGSQQLHIGASDIGFASLLEDPSPTIATADGS